MSSYSQILNRQFSGSTTNEYYGIQSALKELHPGPNTLHIAIPDPSFPLSGFLRAEGTPFEISDKPRNETVSYVNQPSGGVLLNSDGSMQGGRGSLVPRLLEGVIELRYKDTDFIVYKATWSNMRMGIYVFVFDAPENVVQAVNQNFETNSVGHQLITAAYSWQHSLKEEMWVFQNGAWMKDKGLWAAIQQTSWNDIVLDPDFLEGLRRDTEVFFENRAIYKDLGVVWKRGLLLLGPPGNGKTETIKVLLKESGQAALYVKSFSTNRGLEAGVKAIFDHARAHAPCILVIEDLDSLVVSSVRSFFLNELDGLAQNEGILTIATTNHPEQIDDAILNRPSRFDVKYNFDLPTESLRTAYALKWIRKITNMSGQGDSATSKKIAVKFDDEEGLAKDIARGTEGWSFAFLKELFVSFLLRVAHDRSKAHARGDDAPKLELQNTVLLDQMTKLSSQIIVHSSTDEKGAHEPTSLALPSVQGVQAQAQWVGPPPMQPGQNF